MSAIDDIRKQVVQHLLERHYQAKERGEEFFFTVEVATSESVSNNFLQPRINATGVLKISFYGSWEKSQIAYLLVATTNQKVKHQVFLVGEFKEYYDKELLYVIEQIHNFFFFRTPELRRINSQSTGESFFYLGEISEPQTVLKKIDYFLDVIKPELDNWVDTFRLPQYSYYFFNQQQFDEYLKNEPFYKSPTERIKKNLRLETIIVQNFRGIKQAVVTDLPQLARWIVLTGENGFGKTSVLQAIAGGLYGNFDESGRQLIPEIAFVGVKYFANGELVETNSRTPRQDSTTKKLNRELATYGSSRLQVSASVTREMIEEQLPTTYHLFNTDGLLLSVEQLLKDTNIYNKPFYDQLIALFKALIPQLADIHIELVNKKLPEVLYIEQDDANRPLTGGLPFNQLAAGFRNIIAMIGDLVYRLSTKQNVENLRDLQGIVLIDELELHLHPTYQKLLPEVLTNQFPNLQFIVSTHSPIPLLGIPKDVGVVLLHVSRSEETGIVVERLDVDFSVLTPNAILSSPIFGFKDLIPDSKADNRMVRSEDTYEAIQDDQQLRQSINEFLSPERQHELLKLIKGK